MKKIVIIVLTAIIVAFIVYVVYIIITPTKNEMEKDLQKNTIVLTELSTFFEGYEYDYMFISKDDSSLYVSSGMGNGFNISIENENIRKDINFLFSKLGYLFIEKHKNNVRYVKRGFLDNSEGLIYMFNDDVPYGFKVTTLEKLSQEKWYYYKEQ